MAAHGVVFGEGGVVEVVAMKAFLGFVENWRLTQAPTEVQVAFMDAQFVLWAESKRTGQRPELPRKRVRLVDQLLEHELAVEKDGMIEIPCITGVWDAIQLAMRHQSAAGQASAAKRKRLQNGQFAPSTVRSAQPSANHQPTMDQPSANHVRGPENTEVSCETPNGTPAALRARKNLDLKIFLGSEEEEERRKKAPTSSSPKKDERARRCPKSWQPPLDLVALADDLHVNLAIELDKLRDHGFAHARCDWDAVARNWIRNAAALPPKQRAGRMTADERKLEAIRRSDKLFDNWGEGHEPERSQADREQPEHALPSRLVGRTNDPVRH